MPRKTIAALLLQADATLPDNNAQEISAMDVRVLIKDFLDSIAPGYAALSNSSLTISGLGVTPVPLTFQPPTLITPEFSVPNNVSVTRLAQGLPSTVTRLTFNAALIAPNGDEVVFSLFRDGINVPGGTTVSGRGGNNPTEVSFSALSAKQDGTDSVFSVRVSKISGGADDVDLDSLNLICEVVPSLGI